MHRLGVHKGCIDPICNDTVMSWRCLLSAERNLRCVELFIFRVQDLGIRRCCRHVERSFGPERGGVASVWPVRLGGGTECALQLWGM